ncbi:MAG: type II secretion system protein M [Alcanivorax sp.]|nr:type II secretion system protein M [Alcanivorax sp.]
MSKQQWLDTMQARLAPLQQWYHSRDAREQRVLQLLAMVVGAVLLYWMVWQPTLDARNQARRHYQSNTQTLNWINQNAAAVRAASAGQGGKNPSANWVSNVSRSADQYGLTLKGFTPQGNQSVRIQLENQPANQTVLWLQSLKSQGITLNSVEMSPGDKPGTTTLRATLQ